MKTPIYLACRRMTAADVRPLRGICAVALDGGASR